MRSTAKTDPKAPVARRELRLDPYVVQSTTWTRDDLLRARGMPVTHHPKHRTRRAA